MLKPIFLIFFFLTQFHITNAGKLAFEAAQKFENQLEVIATHEDYFKELQEFFTPDFVFTDFDGENFTAFQYIDHLSSRNASDYFGAIEEARFDKSGNLLVIHVEDEIRYKSNYIHNQAPVKDLEYKIRKIEVFRGVW